MSQILAQIQADPVDKLFWPLLTIVGAFSMFPRPPKAYADWISKHEAVQWFCVFILCSQGGAKHDFVTAALVTACVYLAFKVIERYSDMGATGAVKGNQ